MKKIITFLAFTVLFSCNNSAQNINKKQQAVIDADPIVVPIKDGKARAYFASGCFWCVEAVYESVEGVEESISGYSGWKVFLKSKDDLIWTRSYLNEKIRRSYKHTL